MPIHDWTKVDAGIIHHFHHGWVESLQRALNSGVLPPDYYAMAEQHAAGFGPDVLTLQGSPPDPDPPEPTAGGLLLAPPKVQIVDEADMAFYRRKQSTVAVRHVSDDRVVSMIEIVSPGNKSGKSAIRAFVEKAAELLGKGVHLLILDLHPPGPRDPEGIHGVIWDEVDGRPSHQPAEKPLTLAAYEANGFALTAYVQPVAVGDVLPDMPLYLIPGGHVLVPLEKTYQSAWEGVPARWRRVIEGGG